MYTIRKCEKNDIWIIRDFLQEVTGVFDGKLNWPIDRLNFTYAMSRSMNDVSEELYRECIRIVELDGDIIAVVLTEGERRGEAFIESLSHDLDEALLNELFDHIEENLMLEEDDKKFVNLRIARDATKVIGLAKSRGYKKLDWSEIRSKKMLTEILPFELPEGYKVAEHKDISFEEKALGHGKAFGYDDKPVYLKRSEEGLKLLTTMKDYEEELDIHIINESNQVVAFCTMWYDEKNKCGFLEPVGTHPDFRRLGLAKNAIFYACNKIFERGATAVFVGSDQKFYKAIGFEEDFYGDVYSLKK